MPQVLSSRTRRHSVPDRRHGSGQSLVEFVIVLPVLIILLVTVIDFGRLFLSYVGLNNTVRVAANYGSLNPGAYTGTNLATYDSTVGAESASIAGTCPIRNDSGGNNPPLPTFSPSGATLGATSSAAMTCDFSFLTPFMNAIFGGRLPISATANFPVRTGALANVSGGSGIPVPGSPVAGFNFVGISGGTLDGSGNVVGAPGSTVSVGFQDTSTNAQTWDWTFGAGYTDWTEDGAPSAKSYDLGGSTSVVTYTITLAVTNTAGSSTFSRTVTVNPGTANPVAGFYGNPSGAAPQVSGGGPTGTAIDATVSTSVTFINTSSGATAYSWDFGDGSAASTTASPTHVYNALGIYTVTLSITAPTGGTPYTRSSYVTLGCVVPNFANQSTTAAASLYSGAGLTGTLWYQQQGAKNASKSPPGTASTIVSQLQQPGGNWVAPTKQGSHPYGCDYDVTVVYP